MNAATGVELSGGRQDAARMYALLTRADLGGCESASPPPFECQDRAVFSESLLRCLRDWRREDQLLLYYSGHGAVVNNEYVLKFGEDSLLPFASIMADLRTHGVGRAIIILDACQSGEVLQAGRKSGREDFVPKEDGLPRGVALVTSCRARESSYELLDGSASVFTTLLAEAIETGLDGVATPDDVIGVEDAIDYINRRLESPEFGHFPQTAAFGVHAADRTIWLARNRTGKASEAPDPGASHSLHTLEELRLLYENTAPNSRPCPGCTLDDLDWALVEKFARRSNRPLPPDRSEAARQLGLYSRVAPSAFTRAAVLCFAHQPESFLPQARSVFVGGASSGRGLDRVDVLGPLSSQLGRLVDILEDRLHRREVVGRTEDFMLAAREALSNAITHRDYGLPAHVRVQFDFPRLTVTSPGSLPAGMTWDLMMESGPRSNPTDPAVAWYLTALQAAETIGRGFETYRAYRNGRDRDALRGRMSPDLASLTVDITFSSVDESDSFTQVFAPVRGGDVQGDAPPPVAPAPPDATRTEGEETVPSARGPGAAPSEAPARQDGMTRAGGDVARGADLDGHPDELAGCRIEALLGEGGSGSVYLAVEPDLGRQVAIKTLFQRFGSSTQRERFMREARATARLSHPGIVPVYRIGEERDYYYIVMRYVPGDSLRRIIRQRAPLPEAEAARLALQVADALSHAHRAGVIHRDVKPGNVIVDENGNANVTDFGIAQMASEEAGLTQTGLAVGTPEYASPEQLAGQQLDGRSDLYALGLVLYEMLTGESAFEADNFFAIVQQKMDGPPPRLDELVHDPRLADVVDRALQPSPDRRFASAGDMADALAVILEAAENGPAASPSSAPGSARRGWWPFRR